MDIKFYLIILVTLLVFFGLSVYFKPSSQFGKVETPSTVIEKEVYKLDTRFDYPTVPPVNPMIYKAVVLNQMSTDPDLYSNQEMTDGYILNEMSDRQTNQLDYSGGSTELIKIPLQFNEPYNEQLRSQEILITPYNRIKYKSN